MIIAKSFGTHDGAFHADDVTACALLLVFQLIDRDKIVRSRDLKKLATCEYVCDVGGIYDSKIKRFDHHQAEYHGDLSSAGMIWRYLKEKKVVDPEVYHFLNRMLIEGVDAHDNGRVDYEMGWCSFSHVISNFVPPHYDASDQEQYNAFLQAVDFVVGHLQRQLERYHYIRSCREAVFDAMQPRKKYLYFEKAIPWIESFFDLGGEEHPAQFVIMPAKEHWKLRGIAPNLEHRMQVRNPLPEKWAGLQNEELEKISGISGAVFCHKGRFVSVWETKEDAFTALRYILGEDL